MKEADPDMLLARAFLKRELGKENLFTEEQLDVKLVRTLFTNMVNAKNDYDRHLALKTNLPFRSILITALPNSPGVSTQKASEECGFSDYSSFYRSYVKYFHESPGNSRNIARTYD